MLKAERHDKILKEVLKRGPVSVAELAAALRVSGITIRRDLDDLDRGGYLKRIRGGAQPLSPREPEPPILQRQLCQVKEKQAIGAAAVQLIKEGDVIALESGSTTLELARAIANRAWQSLQVVTNSFTIAKELSRAPGLAVVFIGGIVNPDELGTFGILTEESLKRMRINKLFIGCRGLNPDTGLSNDVQAALEIATVRAFAAASNQVVVLADHTKFGRSFLVQMLPISEIDIVVTDGLTPRAILENLGVRQLIVAPPSDTREDQRPTPGKEVEFEIKPTANA